MRASTKIVGVLAAAGALGFSLVVASPAVSSSAQSAGSAPVSGCRGQAASQDGDGKALDTVQAPGPGGTSSDPFHIDVDGKIVWSGSTAGVIRDGSYTVKVSGFEVASGSFENADGKKEWKGTEDVGARLDDIPVLGSLVKAVNPTVTMKVDYKITGQGQTCSGSVIVKIGDSPVGSPLWFGSIGLFLLSFGLLFWPSGWLGRGVR